jgi:hypothetical protein
MNLVDFCTACCLQKSHYQKRICENRIREEYVNTAVIILDDIKRNQSLVGICSRISTSRIVGVHDNAVAVNIIGIAKPCYTVSMHCRTTF